MFSWHPLRGFSLFARTIAHRQVLNRRERQREQERVPVHSDIRNLHSQYVIHPATTRDIVTTLVFEMRIALTLKDLLPGR
jgi:hypothetical protein